MRILAYVATAVLALTVGALAHTGQGAGSVSFNEVTPGHVPWTCQAVTVVTAAMTEHKANAAYQFCGRGLHGRYKCFDAAGNWPAAGDRLQCWRAP